MKQNLKSILSINVKELDQLEEEHSMHLSSHKPY
jgi:hypothetical protein